MNERDEFSLLGATGRTTTTARLPSVRRWLVRYVAESYYRVSSCWADAVARRLNDPRAADAAAAPPTGIYEDLVARRSVILNGGDALSPSSARGVSADATCLH